MDFKPKGDNTIDRKVAIFKQNPPQVAISIQNILYKMILEFWKE